MKNLCLWIVLLTSAAALAQTGGIPSLPPIAFGDNTLSNGLRLIIVPDHAAPVCAISVTYNVGSRNERPGRTGFAHLFEHMMFEGSENVGKGEHFILVEMNGGDVNGTTNEDRTNFFEIFPKNQLDLGLFLEADRMKSLVVNQANLDNQRNAVQEERRLGIDNQPYGKSDLEIDNLAYDNFGYKHSTIGEMRDLNAARIEDVREFFRIYYAPNNAVLTVAGDIDPEEVTKKVRHYFGEIPRQPSPPPVDVSEPEHFGERREVLNDPLARVPRVLIAYHIPAGNTEDNYALQVLGHILGVGNSSRFYQRLVKDKQLATDILVQTDARRGPSLMYVQATLRPGVKPEDLEAAIYAEIVQLQKTGISGEELHKARMQFLRDQIGARQSDLHLANRIGHDVVFFDDPNLINTAADKYNAVTAGQVKAVARKYLVQSQRTVLTTLPATQVGSNSASPDQTQ